MDCFFREVHFYVNDLISQRQFFLNLDYNCSKIVEGEFEVTIGRSKLIYHFSEENNVYHYCILVDMEEFQRKKDLLKSLQLTLVPFEEKEIIHNSSWNSDSIYFIDPNGGMPEFIVHHSLDQEKVEVQLAEVAMAVHDTDDARQKLYTHWGIKPFKGTANRFYDIGIAGSMFIVIDPIQKPHWFPYNYKVTLSKLNGKMQFDGCDKSFNCRSGVLYLDE